MTTATRQRRAAPRARTLLAPALALAGWCASAAFLVVQATAGPALVWNDTLAYSAVAANPLWSTALWGGRRPPLTPLAIKVFGSSAGLLVAQAAIAAVAWGILAWTVGRMVAPGWRRVLAVWVVLAFATAFPVTLWNRSVLSESLALSGLALLFAALIWAARRPTWPRLAAVAAAGLCYAADRDAQVDAVLLSAVAVGIWALAQLGRNRPMAVRGGALAAGLLTIGLLAGWGTVSSHRTNRDVADVLYVRVFPFPDRVAWFADHGMPERRQIDELAAATPNRAGEARVVAFAPKDPAFRPLERWMVGAAGQRTYLLWLVTHPWFVVTEPLQRPERSYNFARGDLTFYAAPVNRLDSPLTPVMWPPPVVVAVMAVVAAGLAVRTGRWRDRAWWAVVILTLVGLVSILVSWHGDGQEVTRHTLEGAAELRLGVWILLLLGLAGSFRTRDRSRRVSDGPTVLAHRLRQLGAVSPPVGAVSPHLDDLALSCAGFLAAHPGSSMVTALAGGPAVVDPLTGWEAISGEFQPGADVVGARRAEDARAAAMLGCHVRHLDHWDHQYRNATYGYRGPTDGAGVARALASDLGRLVESAALDTWMIPLGLSHPDHVIAASACLALVDEFPEVDWLVYEELPYAVHQPGAVGSAIADLRSLGFELRPAGIEVDPDPTGKRRVIDCYHSQVKPLGDGVGAAVMAAERIHRLSRPTPGRAR